MNQKELLKQRMTRDNQYNSFGSDNFVNANTGKDVHMVSERWEYKHYVDNPKSSIDEEIEKLTYNLPEVIDLHQINVKKIQYDYNKCYFNRYINVDLLRLQSLGFIKIVSDNIDKKLLLKVVPKPKYDSYEDRIYHDYLIKLPKYLILDYLPDEYLNMDEELIKKFKNTDIHENLTLGSLPEATLKFLLETYK